MSEDVTLYVDGRIFGGWESVSIQRDLDNLTASFHLDVSDRQGWPIQPGDACTIKVGGETVITGYIDEVAITLNATRHTTAVSGRDATADLVDCSAVKDSNEFINVTLPEILQDLAEPFGVVVKTEGANGEPFERFAIQPGETTFEAIERAARQKGKVLTTSPQGELTLAEIGTKRAEIALIEGVNCLEISGRFTVANRFQHYIVRAQHFGNDLTDIADIAEVAAEVTDQSVKRYRPLIIIAEGNATPAIAEARAKWEASVRAARGSRMTITVQGWRQKQTLWQINTLVACELPSLGLKGDMLIVGVNFELTQEDGTITRLELARPDAYKPDPTLQEEKFGPWKELKGIAQDAANLT